MALTAVVCVDYSSSGQVAAMVVGGMTVLERVLRDAARAGATRAVVIGEAARLPRLPALALAVEIVPPSSPCPDGAEAIAGDQVAGVRIVDEASRRRAERALLETCRRPYDGIGDRYVNRSVSLRLTGVLAQLGATPNQVTCANILVGLVACGFAQHGTWLTFAVAGLLIWIQVVLDSCDGELARIRHMGSRFGMWLDNVSDDVIDNLFVIALGLGLGGAWAVVGVGAACLRGACALMIYRDVARAGHAGDVMAFRWWFDSADDGLEARFEPALTPMAVIRMLGRRDLYVLLWGVTCVIGLPVAALVGGVGISIGYFGLAVAHVLAGGRPGPAR